MTFTFIMLHYHTIFITWPLSSHMNEYSSKLKIVPNVCFYRSNGSSVYSSQPCTQYFDCTSCHSSRPSLMLPHFSYTLERVLPTHINLKSNVNDVTWTSLPCSTPYPKKMVGYQSPPYNRLIFTILNTQIELVYDFVKF